MSEQSKQDQAKECDECGTRFRATQSFRTQCDECWEARLEAAREKERAVLTSWAIALAFCIMMGGLVVWCGPDAIGYLRRSSGEEATFAIFIGFAILGAVLFVLGSVLGQVDGADFTPGCAAGAFACLSAAGVSGIKLLAHLIGL